MDILVFPKAPPDRIFWMIELRIWRKRLIPKHNRRTWHKIGTRSGSGRRASGLFRSWVFEGWWGLVGLHGYENIGSFENPYA